MLEARCCCWVNELSRERQCARLHTRLRHGSFPLSRTRAIRSPSRPRQFRQIVEQHFPVFGGHAGAPANHFVDFAIPLGATETLLADHVFIVAREAGSAET